MPLPSSSTNQCKNPPRSYPDNSANQDLSTSLKEDIDALRVEILQLKTKVDSLSAPETSESPINSGTAHHTQIHVTADIHSPPLNIDSISIASVEEDIIIEEVEEPAFNLVENSSAPSGNTKN